MRRWVALEPDNPETLYTSATFYWKEAMEDSRLTAEEEHAYLVPALTEVERALTVEATTSKRCDTRTPCCACGRN